MSDLFPTGWGHFLAGGLLIGAATAFIFLGTGIRAGASGVFTAVWSWFSRHPGFQDPEPRGERSWRLVFTLGLILGAALFSVLVEGERFVTSVPILHLAIGGLLVGVGTRMSRGCTSGHGICGLSGGARSSLIAVLVFMAFGIGTALTLRALGVDG